MRGASARGLSVALSFVGVLTSLDALGLLVDLFVPKRNSAVAWPGTHAASDDAHKRFSARPNLAIRLDRAVPMGVNDSHRLASRRAWIFDGRARNNGGADARDPVGCGRGRIADWRGPLDESTAHGTLKSSCGRAASRIGRATFSSLGS